MKKITLIFILSAYIAAPAFAESTQKTTVSTLLCNSFQRYCKAIDDGIKDEAIAEELQKETPAEIADNNSDK